MTVARHVDRSRTRDLLVAAACGAFVAVMVGMAYAAVPLYDWFCRATGFGGTTQVAASASSRVLERKITVRFDANVAPGLPWKFAPEVTAFEARLGEVVTLHYRVTNMSARETIGQATYNVTPLTTGAFFQKINCFCFVEQRLKPGEKRDMPVVFYIDPALADDVDGQGVSAITLSYTFFAVRQPEPVASARF
jgi:cytochrome c oxidase assembly protein subunit 11